MHSMFLALTGVFVLASSGAFAQTVATEKKAESASLMENVYSSVDLRQYFEENYTGENRDGGRKYLQSRFYLGTTALNEKLDVFALFRVERHERDTNVTNKGPIIVGSYTPITGKFGSLGLYSENYLKGHDQAAHASYTGPKYTAPNFESDTVLGKVSLGGDVTPVARIDGSAQKVEVIERDVERFAAVNNGDETTKQEDMSYAIWATAQASLEIAGVKGLKVSYLPEYYRDYNPTYKMDAVANDNASFDGYDVTQTTYHYMEVGYALNEQTKISNTAAVIAEGFAEAPKDGKRFMDWVKISYKLK